MTQAAHRPGSGTEPEGRRERLDRLLTAFHEETPQGERPLDGRMLRDLLPYALPHRRMFLVAFLLMPVVAAATVYQPRLLQRAVDSVGKGKSEDVLAQVALEFGAVIVVRFVAQFVQTFTMQLAGQRTVADLRSKVFGHLQRLSISYFDRTPVGRLVTRVTNDMDALSELFASGAVTAMGDVLLLAGIVVAMLSLDLHLSLVAFAALPPMFVVVELFRRRLRRAHRRIRARVAQLNALLNEQVQGVHVVAAFGQEEMCQRTYAEVNASYREANFAQIRNDAALYSVVEGISSICVGLVLWYAARRLGLVGAEEAEITKGSFVAFYAYIQQFFIPVRDLSTKYSAIQSSLASAERVFGLLSVKELDAPDRRGEVADDGVREGDAAIVFDDVSFAYRRGAPVLTDVSFDVPAGSTVAIVGATGAGKTTVTSLMQRFYEPTRGQVRVLGRDARAYERDALRECFAVVQQDVFLFSGDVLENVALGDPEPDAARAREALERVGAWPLLEARGGLSAEVAERGGNLSLGERQLIAFARALYRDPPILILDEATANIDSETEARLQRAVEIVLAERTAIVIAHRLSTIRHADDILVFHHGRLAERGDHATLSGAGGIYARLVRLQQLGSQRAQAAAEASSPG